MDQVRRGTRPTRDGIQAVRSKGNVKLAGDMSNQRVRSSLAEVTEVRVMPSGFLDASGTAKSGWAFFGSSPKTV